MEQNVALIIKYQNVIFLVVVYRSFSVAVSTARHFALLSQTFLIMIWFDSDIVPVCSTIIFWVILAQTSEISVTDKLKATLGPLISIGKKSVRSRLYNQPLAILSFTEMN